MADNVIFKTGALSNLDSVTKKAGQVLFAIDGNNRAYISFDKNANTRCDLYVKVADEATTLTGLTVSAVDLNDINNKAPTSHASSATTYGKGTSSVYGHLKLSDAINSTSSASSGVAATPKAVKTAYDLANTVNTNLSTLNTTVNSTINSLTISGKTITYTTVDGTSGTLTTQDTVYTLPVASSTLGGVKTTSTVTSTSGLTACPIIDGVPYYKNSTYTVNNATITIKAGTGLATGGNFTTNQSTAETITLDLADTAVSAGSYGPSANATPAHGETFSVPYFTVDAQGRLTSASTKTITLPTDANSHYSAYLYLGASGASSNTTTAVSNPYINLRENSTNRSSIQIKGGTNIAVSGVNGIVTISNNYSYTLPTASSTVLGGVKVGDNINLLDGVISLNNSNVTSALGYTPVNKVGDTMSGDLTVSNSSAARLKTTCGSYSIGLFAQGSETGLYDYGKNKYIIWGQDGDYTFNGIANNAVTANALSTGHYFHVNLGSTSNAYFDGSANCSPGITGTLGPANGGTGKTTLEASANALINSLSEGTSDAQMNDYYVAQYSGGGTTTTTYHRRKISAIYNCFKGSLVQKTGDTMSGHLGIMGDWIGVNFKDANNENRGVIYCVPGSDSDTAVSGLRFGVKRTDSSYYDYYTLPLSTSGLTSSKWHNILTTKNAVTVAQGGTGATTAANARANLGITMGQTSMISFSANHTADSKDVTINFGKTYSSAPKVFLSPYYNNHTNSVDVHKIWYEVIFVNTTSCIARVLYPTSATSALNLYLNWIAIG